MLWSRMSHMTAPITYRAGEPRTHKGAQDGPGVQHHRHLAFKSLPGAFAMAESLP